MLQTLKYFVINILSLHPKRAFKQLYYWILLRNPKPGTKLHLGCGKRSIDGFINIDLNYSTATDFVCNVDKLPCPNNSISRIETYHMIEHIPYTKIDNYLYEWNRILKKKGTLIIECPAFDEVLREYLLGNEERIYNIFGRWRFPGDAHHWGYTSKSLKLLIEKFGFSAKLSLPIDYHKDLEPCLRMECEKLNSM